MKTAINVVHIRHPKRGRYIGEGKHEYFLTPDGLPAMHFRWRGMMFNGPKMTFVFPRDVVEIRAIDDDVSKSQARWSAFNDWSSRGAAGLIVNVVAGTIGAAATRTKNISGFEVAYHNEGGHIATFMAVGSPEIVDEIFRAVPQEKHNKSTQASEPPQATQQPKPS